MSKGFIELLEAKLANHALWPFISAFITNLVNTQVFVVKHEDCSNENEILDLIDRSFSETKEAKGVTYFVFSKTDSKKVNNINLLSLNKANRNWVLFKTCCHHPNPLVLRYSDFKQDHEIEKVICGFLNAAQGDDAYYILDRQTNFNHKLFDSFKQTALTHYYTSSRTVNGAKQDFKKTFKRLKVFSGKHEDIHERKLLKRDFIIEIDEDFWNIGIARNTWKMDLTYCSKTSKLLRNKVSKFKRVDFN
ncbi:hypothetical protein [uncultured Pedobacter sp.]|nr:hypothetical protein [uncultured Pedobacter sp.]